MPLIDMALRVANFKSFGPTPQGFPRIDNINILVGRNNSGKSALIDLVSLVVERNLVANEIQWHNRKPTIVTTETTISPEEIKFTFPSNQSNDSMGNYYAYGRQFEGKRLVALLGQNDAREFSRILDLECPERDYREEVQHAHRFLQALANRPERNPLIGRTFIRLNAERDISPETDSNQNIQWNGTGITSAIQRYLNKSHLPRDLIRVELLNALNRIFNPDTSFDEIICRQQENNAWEIFLAEHKKGLIALSQSGSGLKTVIATLCFIHLVPHILDKSLDTFIMAFEELENNLHPALQRRLLDYIYKKSIEHNFPVFLTTHSSIAIDLFNKRQESSIYHVTHDGTESKCTRVEAYVAHRGILDDLDIRASDLLQANGIIWVEGPSDRVYINHWINLYSDGELTEGIHYQCVFYGGRLLSHLSADETDSDTVEGVSILRVNRNAAVIIDSDKRTADDPLNDTKQRIISEVKSMGGIAWVTSGREIENCVPFSCLKAWAEGKEIKLKTPPERFVSVFDYLDARKSGFGKKMSKQKAVLAESFRDFVTKDNLTADPELNAKVSELCAEIRKWNQLPEPTPPEA
ncbi:ATP-dependent endonuclease [Cupriavidus sp. SW-Y-13]|uniref:ATP-dependent nuclease n=1 Tax=Cupriavidus sp. SW-Y-13 TaxID=2653854 RepID=UPI00136608CA|nr:ATP-binding protein [Cupriavidus sp. SW-Y-13]MWL87685.1 AAA family ATPase [Cupriavidus sp. SW-Y-13]